MCVPKRVDVTWQDSIAKMPAPGVKGEGTADNNGGF